MTKPFTPSKRAQLDLEEARRGAAATAAKTSNAPDLPCYAKNHIKIEAVEACFARLHDTAHIGKMMTGLDVGEQGKKPLMTGLSALCNRRTSERSEY